MDAAAAAASGSGSVERRLIDWPARRRVSAHRWARRAAPHARPAAAATEWYDELVAFSQRSLIHTVLCLRGLCSLVPIIRFPCAFTLILYFHSAQRSTLPHSLPSQNVLSPSLTEFALRRRFAVRSAVTQIGSTVQYNTVQQSVRFDCLSKNDDFFNIPFKNYMILQSITCSFSSKIHAQY